VDEFIKANKLGSQSAAAPAYKARFNVDGSFSIKADNSLTVVECLCRNVPYVMDADEIRRHDDAREERTERGQSFRRCALHLILSLPQDPREIA
jgi:hypothetical protein